MATLEAHYKLDELPAAAIDAAGGTSWSFGSGVTAGGTALLSDGGTSVHGSGSSPIASLAAVATGLSGGNVTLEAWITIPAGNVNGPIINIGNETANGWAMGVGGTTFDNAGKQLIFVTNAIAWNVSGYTFSTGTHHVMAARGSGNTVRCYVDGSLVATVTLSTPNTATSTMHVGGSQSRALSSTVQVDNVALYASDLTAAGTTTARVTAHYNSGSGDNSAVAADSPVVWLKLDESSATNPTTFTDSSGNSRPATISGAATLGGAAAAVGIPGASASFVTLGGVHQYGVVSSPTWFRSLSALSIKAWFKTTATGGYLVAMDNTVSSPGSADRKFQFYLDSSGKVTFLWFTTIGGFPFVSSASGGYNDGNWHQAIVTRSTTTVKIYIDGSLVATSSPGGVWSGSNVNLTIGDGANLLNQFVGSLDDVKLWSGELTATEVSSEYAADTASPTASQSYTGSPNKVAVSTQPGSYSAGTKVPQSFSGSPAKVAVSTQPGSYFAGTKIPQAFSGRPMSLVVTAQPGDAQADERIPALFTGSVNALIVNASVGSYLALEKIPAAFEGRASSLLVAAPLGTYATVSDRAQSYTGAPARLITTAPRGAYYTTLPGDPLDAYTEGEITTDGGMDLSAVLGGPLDSYTEGWIDGGGDGVPFAPYSLDAYTEGWAEGRPTLTVSVDPVTGRPQYVLKVVDMDGTVVLELADAAPGVASQSLNGRGGSAFAMGAQDAQLRHVPQFKEVQLWRGGVLVPGAWWTVADPEINLNADTYGFDCPGLYYYMERRLIGKERPEYLLNGGFESGIAGWMMGWSPGSNAETPPEWELTDDAREGGQALRVFAQNRVVTTRVSRETVAMFYGNRPYASEPLSAGFMPGGEQQVRDLLEEMNPPEHSTITIEGHTADADGGTGYALSVRRAQAAREVVLAERSDLTVIAVGKGETEPVDPRHTEDAYRKNRRIVMVGTFTETKIGHRQFTQASFTESLGPVGTYEPLEFDIQGQGRIDVWEGPSKDGWMLYADVRPESNHAVIKNNDYVTVDESTPRGVWIPLHVTVKVPNDGTEYRVFIRGYPTAGATSFDQMSAMPNLKLAFRQKDARYIIGQLVAHAQDPEFEKDDLNIQAYGPAAGVLLQKEYPWKEHVQVSTAIDDIVRASFGPDANMLYTATRRLLTVYPKQGLQTGLTFATDGYVGDATIVAFSAPLDGDDVVTTAYVQSSWSGGGMTEYVVREPRGDIPVMESLFHAEQDAPTSTVASQGRSAVAYGRSSTVSRVVMSNADTTMLMGEVHIGDVVWIEAHSERVDAAGAYRIIQIDLDPDNDQYAYDVSPSD